MDQLLKDIDILEAKKASLRRDIETFSNMRDTLNSEFNEIISKVKEFADRKYKETIDYINSFFKTLSECETPEARDSIKIAQTYINAVSIDTKYDNTAFIIGLASILSQWNTGAIEQLYKINPKIPEIQIDVQTDRESFHGADRKIWRVTEKKKTPL